MASYYKKFIKSYAKIASPLTALLKKDIKFKLTPECEDAFNTLKQALTSAPVLAFPKFDRPSFRLLIGFSIGYILSQIGENNKENNQLHSAGEPCMAMKRDGT